MGIDRDTFVVFISGGHNRNYRIQLMIVNIIKDVLLTVIVRTNVMD